MKVVRGPKAIKAARRATVEVCDLSKEGHRGQGLLLDLGKEEGAVVLTCHHLIAPVKRENLYVRIPQVNSRLGKPVPVRYDEERSRPQMDAVVLRVKGITTSERPLLHKLNLNSYNGSLDATVLVYLQPDNFNAEVRPSAWLDIEVQTGSDWPGSPEHYAVRVFRLRTPDNVEPGISGGTVLCEEGVLGLVHFARGESGSHAREDYLVPLTVWAERWDALERLIEPLIDGNLQARATVNLSRQLGVKRANQLEISSRSVIANFQEDVYVEREVDDQARTALDRCDGVVIVGRPKSGKTRLAWQLLQERPEALVIIPHSATPPPKFETSGIVDSELVIFLDDLHRVAETMDPLEWHRRLNEISERCLLVCTARDGKDWDLVKHTQENLVGRYDTVFTSRVGEPGKERGKDFSEDEAQRLAIALSLSEDEYAQRLRHEVLISNEVVCGVVVRDRKGLAAAGRCYFSDPPHLRGPLQDFIDPPRCW